MSDQNVEIVRRLYEAWQRDGFDVVPELMDPDIEWVNPSYAVEPGTRRGYAGFAAAARSFTSVYHESRVKDATFYDAGDRIAVKASMVSRSGGSEFPIDAQRGYVFDLRGGKVTRFAWFNNPAEAREAVGLTEQAVAQANVELVKQALDAFNRRDLDSYDDLYTSDFAGFPSMAGIVEGGGYTGRDGFETFLVGLHETWDGFRVLADVCRAIGERVLVLCRITGRARSSGVEVEGLGAMVFEFRAGKISRVRDFLDRSEAVQAARLAE